MSSEKLNNNDELSQSAREKILKGTNGCGESRIASALLLGLEAIASAIEEGIKK